ncbi:MAG: redoxin domain-containing protein [Bacteroidales bacterium]|nr:redoxin domain-containing protein [Bacteroidales bacterium]
MKKFLPFLLVFLVAACSKETKFTVEGIIEGAEGEVIYLEHNGLTKSTLLDSMVVKSDGGFHFRSPRPEYPDFYKLILNGKQLHFAVDSIETLVINSNIDRFSTDYTISGSETNTDILQLRQSVAAIQKKANLLVQGIEASEREKIVGELTAMIETHKSMARPLILKNPRSAAAYFAIFQKVNNVYMFSPYVKEDRPYCAAVATAYHTFMPGYERSKNLYALVMDAINTERLQRREESLQEMINNATAGYIDIELPDRTRKLRKLSDLKGKVVLLDFSAYEARESVQYTFALRDLYAKYSAKGFEIYQVSLDRNETLWNDATAQIPWIAVRDQNGPASVVAGTYNVTQLPTYFLISKEGDILGRNMNIQELERAIQQQL